MNYNDFSQVGMQIQNDDSSKSNTKINICTDTAVQAGLCTNEDLGRVLVNKNGPGGKPFVFSYPVYSDQVSTEKLGIGYTALEKIEFLKSGKTLADWDSYASKPRNTTVPVLDGLAKSQIASVYIDWSTLGEVKVSFPINSTGYYCVDAVSSLDFSGKAVWMNYYGTMPASEYIKLPLYRALTLLYACYCLVWAWMTSRVWHDVLPLQHYIWVLIAIMVTNMGLSSLYWDHYNTTGSVNTGLTIAMVFFYAARNSLAFFLLLVVSLGWGIVRPSLGPTMKRCLLLLFFHFVSGCIYGTSTALQDQNELNDESLLVVLPISICTTIYYVWTMKSVIATTRILEQRNQTYKLYLFQRMWNLLLANIAGFFAFIVVNFVVVVLISSGDSISRLWRWQWLIFDGWLNIQFFITFSIILWWWRPTSNNGRYGLEQLAGDEDAVWERGPEHDGHAMMLADERDFQLALEEADQVADSFVLQNRLAIPESDDEHDKDDNRSSMSSFERNVFVLDDDDYADQHPDVPETNGRVYDGLEDNQKITSNKTPKH
ncbi:hypothetical protein BB560_002792 [Smittium megazygosporum]|uniref:GOST seven transmembrane domain-containing protein n=1 Tax=Smittium megazygosporum TaxID=133381 RepID=A0A2T9ZDT2_9FUNG|nr:hypothetical protein BB560_002792 [Smittium megazygosporum]